MHLLREGNSIEDIAKIRGRQYSTVVSAVAGMVERGELEFQSGWVAEARQAMIEAACAQVGMDGLRALKDVLPPEISYEEIKLVVALVRRKKGRVA